jgi:hypothetical protein
MGQVNAVPSQYHHTSRRGTCSSDGFFSSFARIGGRRDRAFLRLINERGISAPITGKRNHFRCQPVGFQKNGEKYGVQW